MSQVWIEQAKVRSRSNPQNFWVIKKNRATGEIGCGCPAWRFRGRTCRHVDVYKDSIETSSAANDVVPVKKKVSKRPMSNAFYDLLVEVL